MPPGGRRGSAPRRSAPGLSLLAPHLVLDTSRVLLELERVCGELDDPLLVVVGGLPPDIHVPAFDLDQVVARSSVPPQAQRRHRARVDDEDVLQAPGIGNVLVAGENEVYPRALQRLE